MGSLIVIPYGVQFEGERRVLCTFFLGGSRNSTPVAEHTIMFLQMEKKITPQIILI